MQVTDPKQGQVLYTATARTDVEDVRSLEDLDKVLCVEQYVGVELCGGGVGVVATAHDAKSPHYGYARIVGEVISLPELWTTPEEALASAVERLVRRSSNRLHASDCLLQLHALDCLLQVLWVWKEKHRPAEEGGEPKQQEPPTHAQNHPVVP